MPDAPDYEYYGLMARHWDLLRGDTSGWADRFLYLDVVGQYGQPVLDVGCSSGRLVLDYLAAGLDVDGVDVSPEMIDLCRRNAERRGLNATLSVQDVTQLDLPRRYRTVLVPSSTLQLLLEPGEPLRALERIREHLEPGGACVAPFMALWRPGDPLEGEVVQEATTEDGDLVRRSGWWRYDPATGLEETRDVWEVLRGGRVVESETHVRAPATRSYDQDEAVELFRQAGFQDLRANSEFRLEPVRPDDNLFTVIGVRA